MKYALSVLTMTMALSSGAAFAAEGDVLGPGQTAQVVVPFTNQSGLTHQLAAVDNLHANYYGSITKIANGSVSVIEGPAVPRVSVRWASGNKTDGETEPFYRTIVGENNSNSIKVSIGAPGGYIQANEDTDSVDLLATSGSASSIFYYDINLIAGQNVAADRYTMVISAHKFTS